MLHQIKAQQFHTDLGLQKTLLNPPVNGKIQGLFKGFECFSSTFRGKFTFQGLFKTVLYIQALFKPVQTLLCILRGRRLLFPQNIVFISLKIRFVLANSADPDEMPQYVAFIWVFIVCQSIC